MSLNSLILARSPIHYLRCDDGTGTLFAPSDDGSNTGAPSWLAVDALDNASLDQNDSNKALYLDSYILAGAPITLANHTSVFVLGHLDDVLTTAWTILWTRIDDDNRYLLRVETTGQLVFHYRVGGVTYTAATPTGAVSPSTNYAFGATFTGSAARVYLNGTEYTGSGPALPAAVGSTGTQIDAKAGNDHKVCIVDEFAMFSTDESANQHPFAAAAGYAGPTHPILSANQVI